jgi:hypothetical protein
MTHFLCQLLSTDTRNPSLVLAMITQLIQKNLFSGWVKESLVSVDWRQFIPKIDLWCQLPYASRHHLKDTNSNYNWIFQIQIHAGFKSYMIQIHIIILTYIQIIAKYFTIFRFIVCTHFHIVKNCKLHQLFTQQIFYNYIVEETPLTSRSCWRMHHLCGRSQSARTCKCPI